MNDIKRTFLALVERKHDNSGLVNAVMDKVVQRIAPNATAKACHAERTICSTSNCFWFNRLCGFQYPSYSYYIYYLANPGDTCPSDPYCIQCCV